MFNMFFAKSLDIYFYPVLNFLAYSCNSEGISLIALVSCDSEKILFIAFANVFNKKILLLTRLSTR